MQYPDDFNTPAFPAGKRIAVARVMAIAISIGLLIAVFLSGMILWAAKSKTIEPFLISVNPGTGAWTLVGHGHRREHNATYMIQESVIRRFVKNWFEISGDSTKNDARWELCGMDFCNSNEYRAASQKCALACISGTDLMENFVYTIVPTYQDFIAAGGTWILDEINLELTPMGDVTRNGVMWKISGRIVANYTTPADFVAFARIGWSAENYQQTMGYYVA